MELNIFNIKGSDTGKKLFINQNIYTFINALSYNNKILIKLEVIRYLSSQRQGTHKSKERWAIKGSGKKLQKQKGTGNSRKGNIKNPIFRGGGRIFGPRPRKYTFKLNRASKRLIKKMIISYKIYHGLLKVFNDFNLKDCKTRTVINMLNKLNLLNKKILFILDDFNLNIFLACRNISNLKVLNVCELNSYDMLKYMYLFITEKAVHDLDKFLLY